LICPNNNFTKQYRKKNFMQKIATALVKAQNQFGPALKSNTNPHFRSKYADLSACVEAVVDALNANGVFLMQQTSECLDGVIVETLFLHESGESLSSGKLHVPAAKQDPQGYGSALTYARRYSLMAACGIAPEDDDGNAASRKQETKVNASAMADHLAAIDATSNKEELQTAYAAAYEACNGDQTWQSRVMAAKAARIKKAKETA
jgi:hypothetical protein